MRNCGLSMTVDFFRKVVCGRFTAKPILRATNLLKQVTIRQLIAALAPLFR